MIQKSKFYFAWPKHWCLKSVKGGVAIAIVACLKKFLDVLSLRIDAQKLTHDTLQDTKENV